MKKILGWIIALGGGITLTFFLVKMAKVKKVNVFLAKLSPYMEIVEREAKANTIDPDLISALIWQESSGNVDNKVYEGKPDWYQGKILYSYGLMGLTFPAASDMGYTGKEEDLMNPDINIKYGTLYLRWQIDRYNGDVSKGLVAYNAGHFTGNYTYAHNVWVKMRKIQESKK